MLTAGSKELCHAQAVPKLQVHHVMHNTNVQKPSSMTPKQSLKKTVTYENRTSELRNWFERQATGHELVLHFWKDVYASFMLFCSPSLY